jgi:hypothetical protein
MAFYTILLVIGLVAMRMLFVNPAWFFFPKSWQRWLFGGSGLVRYSPFKIKSK